MVRKFSLFILVSCLFAPSLYAEVFYVRDKILVNIIYSIQRKDDTLTIYKNDEPIAFIAKAGYISLGKTKYHFSSHSPKQNRIPIALAFHPDELKFYILSKITRMESRLRLDSKMNINYDSSGESSYGSGNSVVLNGDFLTINKDLEISTALGSDSYRLIDSNSSTKEESPTSIKVAVINTDPALKTTGKKPESDEFAGAGARSKSGSGRGSNSGSGSGSGSGSEEDPSSDDEGFDRSSAFFGTGFDLLENWAKGITPGSAQPSTRTTPGELESLEAQLKKQELALGRLREEAQRLMREHVSQKAELLTSIRSRPEKIPSEKQPSPQKLSNPAETKKTAKEIILTNLFDGGTVTAETGSRTIIKGKQVIVTFEYLTGKDKQGNSRTFHDVEEVLDIEKLEGQANIKNTARQKILSDLFNGGTVTTQTGSRTVIQGKQVFFTSEYLSGTDRYGNPRTMHDVKEEFDIP